MLKATLENEKRFFIFISEIGILYLIEQGRVGEAH
jgi:hypothetical protein